MFYPFKSNPTGKTVECWNLLFPCRSSRHQNTSVSKKVVQIIEEHCRLGCVCWSRWGSTWWLNVRNWYLEKFHIGTRRGQRIDFLMSYYSSIVKILEQLSLILFDFIIVTNGFDFQLQRIHFLDFSQYQWIRILRRDWNRAVRCLGYSKLVIYDGDNEWVVPFSVNSSAYGQNLLM